MARRLRRAGVEVVGYNRSREVTDQLAKEEGFVARLFGRGSRRSAGAAARGLADVTRRERSPNRHCPSCWTCWKQVT